MASPSPDEEKRPRSTGSCLWTSPQGIDPSFGVSVHARQIPVDEFKTESGDPFPETAATYDVAGYRAEQIQDGAGLEQLGCSVGVDVAEGQTLEAFTTVLQAGSMSNQDMCAKAKQAAEFAVTNLQAQG